MKFSEDMFTYVYKFFLDNENNIIKDTIEVFDLKEQKNLEFNSQNFYKYKLIFNWEELESENWNKEIQTKILNLINEKFSVEGIKNRKFYQQLKKITANNISESFFNVIKKDLNKYSVVLLSFYKEQFENKINDSNNDRGNNLLSFYLISMMNWTVKKYSNYDNKRLTTNN